MPLDLIIIFDDPAVDYSWEETHMVEMTLRGMTVEPEKYGGLAKQIRLLMNTLISLAQQLPRDVDSCEVGSQHTNQTNKQNQSLAWNSYPGPDID